MDIVALIIMALIGALLGVMVGMAFATDFECDKKYGKAALIYFVCAIIGSLEIVVPVLIMCM